MRLSGKKILVVDDEADLREIIRDELEMEGGTVFEAGNGKEALAIAMREPVDAVISDIRMPGGGGVELLDALREHNPETPVMLLITGFSDLTTEEAFHRGAEAILSKPFDIEELVNTLVRALLPCSKRWQRRHERVETNLPFAATVPGVGLVAGHQISNIGRGGVFVHAAKDFPQKGDVIAFQLAFFQSDLKPIHGVGIVRWVRQTGIAADQTGYGLEFQSLDQESLALVEAFCRRVVSKPFIPNR